MVSRPSDKYLTWQMDVPNVGANVKYFISLMLWETLYSFRDAVLEFA